jgi:hypothetical protein
MVSGVLFFLVIALGAFYVAGSIFVDPLLRRKRIAFATAVLATAVGFGFLSLGVVLLAHSL